MKKIMFNDIYGLTKAVIDGHKTMTRRIVPDRMGKLLDVNSKGLLIIPRSSIPDCMTPEQFAEEFAKYPGVITFEKNKVQEVKPAIDIREECIKLATYKVGEEVAVAQCYRTIYTGPGREFGSSSNNSLGLMMTKGWENKMFVRSDLMKHQIQITGIKIERLQDISDEDAIKEGIRYYLDYSQKERHRFYYDPIPNYRPGAMTTFSSAKAAFASLIDKVSGKGTWERNPWVFAYSFKKIK